jgi:putative hydrolase of the HAD superfamily
MDRFFAAIADSSRVGVFKPDPGIFEFALKKMQTEAAETAIVGDSLGKDCAPARKLGLRTVWLRTDSNRPVPEDAAGLADITIGSLDEVARIEW